ncbi:MAG TPA: hypothetical protein VEF06_08905 [Bryobacteraceae bacterium]|nr:hypothetical protein [Bryobacteraceae bacterium]
MKFIGVTPEELSELRADPLLVEQELDVWPRFAESIEQAVGMRCGRVYWRGAHGHLYALELGDLGRGRPSTATVYGFWERFEPRPAEREIDEELFEFVTWVAEVAGPPSVADVEKVAQYAGIFEPKRG